MSKLLLWKWLHPVKEWLGWSRGVYWDLGTGPGGAAAFQTWQGAEVWWSWRIKTLEPQVMGKQQSAFCVC